MLLFPRPQSGPQMRPPPAPIVGGAGSGPVAAAALAPVVASAAAGYRRRRRRRRERGEGKEDLRRCGGGMRASDIGGVGGPAAIPAPGPSPQRHRLPLLAVQPPGIDGCTGVGNIYQRKAMPDIWYRGVVVQPTGQYAQDTGFETGSKHFSPSVG